VFDSYDLDQYDARILRGEPVRAGRMEAIPFRLYPPRTPCIDSIYDDQEAMGSAPDRIHEFRSDWVNRDASRRCQVSRCGG
jgi:hypothetical protein